MAKRHRVPKDDESLQTRLGAVIRICRRRLGITQEELAWRAKMHRTYIADIERGARNVTLRSIDNLAAALEVTLGELFSFADAPQHAALHAAAPEREHGGREILLIEDNATDADLAVRAFARARFANPVTVVADAEDALHYLRGTGPHQRRGPTVPQLLLLDLHLPGMSGVEFLREIKADERLREIPVVILAASEKDAAIVECNRLGVQDHVVKPLSFESFSKVTPHLNLHWALVPAAVTTRARTD